MSDAGFSFDWSDLAFGSKTAVNNLKSTFILAPRELSVTRFTQLVKQYLPQGNIVLGIAKEAYILGFENQPQFRTLRLETVSNVIDKVNASKSPYKIYNLSYFQRETDFTIQKLKFQRTLLVNGSWQLAFHNSSTFYAIINRGLPYDYVTPFADEAEAKAYEAKLWLEIHAVLALPTFGNFGESEMLQLAAQSAKQSYDYSFQTGVTLGKKTGKGYELLATSFNKVVPYQTYAMHYGASRERNFSPPHDLNHYDTVHAEVELILAAQRQKLDLHDTTVFINLLPCPPCARMLAESDIAELVYRQDHSAGYAIAMLEAAGKKVRRVV